MSHRRLRPILASAAALAAAGAALAFAASPRAGASTPAPNAPFETWVNFFRAQSGLSPVALDADWSEGARLHSCWMLRNGLAHDEASGTPGYTAAGDEAGNAGNVAVSGAYLAPNATFVDLWMTAPFHAIGLLRPGLGTVGAGRCDSALPFPGQTSRSAATIDVLRGLDQSMVPTAPVVFPGRGSTTHLHSFIAESPDPRSFCGWSALRVGLPLVVLLPEAPVNPTATLQGPNGRVDVCVLSAANTSGVARSILEGDRAVVVVPKSTLTNGAWSASVASGSRTVAWSFTVASAAAPSPTTTLPPAPAPTTTVPGSGFLPNPTPTTTPAPLPTPAPFPTPAPLPTTPGTTPRMDIAAPGALGLTATAPARVADSTKGLRLRTLAADVVQRIQVAGNAGIPAGARAVFANFTVAGTRGAGTLTVFPCGTRPGISTVTWSGSSVSRSGAQIAELDATGGLCVSSTVATNLLVDVFAHFAPTNPGRFTPTVPIPVADTRSRLGGVGRLSAGRTVMFTVAGVSAVPADAQAAVLNVTALNPAAGGSLVVFPCGTARPAVSTLHFPTGGSHANMTFSRLGGGKVCVQSTRATDVAIEVLGFVGTSGMRYRPMAPTRVLDTRSTDPAVSAGTRGAALSAGQTVTVQLPVPASASSPAAAVTLSAIGPQAAGWLAVGPAQMELSASPALVFASGSSAANSTQAVGMLGQVVVTASASAHATLDITGFWVF